MNKALIALIIISIVLISIFIIYPIAVMYYALYVLDSTYKDLRHKALVEYDKEHNTNYAETLN